MTHFLTLVVTDSGAEEEVERLLEPYDENGEWFSECSRWDWWVIGGRFTGFLDDYDPELDPDNREICDLCGGSGQRPGGVQQFGEAWVRSTGGCNGCGGTGVRTKWPTEWVSHKGDVQPVRELDPSAWPWMPTAVLTPDGVWHEHARMGWWGMPIEGEHGEREKSAELWAATVRALLEQYPDAVAFVVDCHV